MADGWREGSADEGRTEEASTTKIEKMYSRLVCDDSVPLHGLKRILSTHRPYKCIGGTLYCSTYTTQEVQLWAAGENCCRSSTGPMEGTRYAGIGIEWDRA